ncbi:MAG TPA: site-2 protease family protein [Pirellulaceae bacterium]|jgi:putative peptide zinc metalloprotease protein
MADLDHQILDPAQSRLRLRTDLIVLPHDAESFVIEDPLSGKFFLIGCKEWSFVSQLDGARTIAVAVGRSASHMGTEALSEQEAISVARWLVEQGLARPVDVLTSAATERKKYGPKKKPLPFNPLAWKLPLGSPDRLLVAGTPATNWLWSGWFFLVWLLLGTFAVAKIAAHASDLRSLPMEVLDQQNWLRLAIVYCVLKLFHELAHGLACRHFGVPVRQAGIMFLMFAPMPFVDVSRAWRLPSRWQRIVISAAGMYVELFLAFAAICLWTPASLNTLDRICVEFALLASIHTLAFNANPLMRFDGYYILADALGVPNLYNESQQRVSALARYWFAGVDVVTPPTPLSHRVTTSLYGGLSFAWRCVSFFGMAAALLARWGWWGIPAVALLWALWFGVPFLKKRPKRNDGPASSAARTRQIVSWSTSLSAAALLLAWLISPAHLTAPAIVEYAPLTILRAKAAGFVTAVHVEDGQTVAAGQLLLELTNEELLSELKTMEVGAQQARLKSRLHYLQGELSKQQAELASADSFERRASEVRDQLNGLQLRAPFAAKVVSRGLSSLENTYVEQGGALVSLGTSDEKELLVSVAAKDQDEFRSQVDEPVNVYRQFSGSPTAVGSLAQVQPRLSQHLPHPALGADQGGQVVVQHATEPHDESSDSPYISLQPRSIAKVALDSQTASRLAAGERVTVGLRHSSQTWGRRILNQWNDYLQQLATQTALAEAAAK